MSNASNEPRPSYPRTQYTVSRAHVTMDPATSTVACKSFKNKLEALIFCDVLNTENHLKINKQLKILYFSASTTISENPYVLQGGYDTLDRPHAHVSSTNAPAYR